MTKLLTCLLWLFISLDLTSAGRAVNVRMLKCTGSNRTIDFKMSKCWAKSYGRNISTVNAIVNVTRPVYQASVSFASFDNQRLEIFFQVHFDMRHRSSSFSPYYSVFINSTFDVCRFMNGTENNLIMKLLFKLAEDTLPKQFIHPCPYHELIEGYNITAVPKNELVQFLNGYYRIIARIFNIFDDNIITITAAGEIVNVP